MAGYSFLVAFVCCVAIVPVVVKLATHWSLFDPFGPLKLHSRPISRLGGIAVNLAFAAGVIASDRSSDVLYLLLAIVILSVTGLMDDVRGLSPATRFVTQIIAALVLYHGADPAIVVLGSKALGWAAGTLFVVALVNAFNLLDGADGVAAGVAAIIALGYLAIGTQPGVARTSAWTLLGGCLGFLLFNFPPARIFLGDSGSTVLGLVIAFTGLELHKSNPATNRGLFISLIFAGLPLLDLVLAIVRRVRSGASPFLGDRRHFYDLLLQRGWSPRSVAFSTYAITGGFVMVGLESHRHDPLNAIVPVLLVTIPFLLLAVHLGSLRTAV
jgi:UDP-GlcNAc:undecaprenyl-phosphate/decaprenyl-phosphate GlcNAc-1-phosphate transferase